MNLRFPPLDGTVSAIPGFIDFQAQNNSDRPWVLFPSGSRLGSLSYKDYADATHRTAHVFSPGMRRANKEVVALIIHCDAPLYLAVLGGLIRAGFIPFPMSPRNSIPAFVNMLEKTSCHRIITQPNFSPLVASIQSQLHEKSHPIVVDDLPGLYDIFPLLGDSTGKAAANVVPFPASDSPCSMDDIVLYLHSSGSTGHPKPIPTRHRFMIECCTSSIHAETRHRSLVWGAMALPTFHMLGFFTQFLLPLSTSNPIGLFYPASPAPPQVPSPEILIEACKATATSAIPTVPAFVEAWAKSEDHIKYLSELKILAFSGGPVSEQVGDRLAALGIPFCAVYGGTEFGVYTKIFDTDYSSSPKPDAKGPSDWAWMAMDERLNARWVPQGDGSFELQFLTNTFHHPSVENLADTRGYATHDLFIPHPHKAGLWKIVGRKDDVIVLGTGEKVVPIPQEGMITSSPLVAGCVMFGRGRNECGILVEPVSSYSINAEDEAALIEFRNLLWPIVEKANAIAPNFSRIFKEMIICTDPGKPLPRAGKGTVVRPQALDLYGKKIDELYETVALDSDSQGIAAPSSWEESAILPWLEAHCAVINGGTGIDPNRDLFDQGFDSLHATFLRNRVIAALRSSAEERVKNAALLITPSFIFEHPTLQNLADALASTIVSGADAATQPNLAADIQTMLYKYTQHLPRVHRTNGETHQKDAVVLLTGTTGAVGSHILSVLLGSPAVRQVYTISRSETPSQQQAAVFEQLGLAADLLRSSKLIQLNGDITKEQFGLDSATIQSIKDSVTHVVHCAWRVDFNLPLASFEQHVAGVRRLVDFCASVEGRATRLLFTSTVSSAHKQNPAKGPIPEESLSDVSVATANGYSASKFVAEGILAKAAGHGLECTALRVGMVCGPKSTGIWSTTEWVPIMIKSSVSVGMFPTLEGSVSWIPVDAVGAIIKDLVLSDKPVPPVLNVVHPRPTTWNAVLSAVNTYLGGEPLPMVPYSEWLHALDAVAARNGAQDIARVPALKLLPFFRGVPNLQSQVEKDIPTEAGGLPVVSTKKLQLYSPTSKDLAPIGEDHVVAWVKYWKAIGFLSVHGKKIAA